MITPDGQLPGGFMPFNEAELSADYRYARFRGSGARWWREIVSQVGEEGPVLEQPAIAGDRVELIPNLQPTMAVNPRHFTKDPTAPPIIFVHQTARKVEAAHLASQSISVPLVVNDDIHALTVELYGAQNAGTHVMGIINSLVVGFVFSEGTSPNYTPKWGEFVNVDSQGHRKRFNEATVIRILSKIDVDGANVAVTMVSVLNPLGYSDALRGSSIVGFDQPKVLPIGREQPALTISVAATQMNLTQRDVDDHIWFSAQTSGILYPRAGLPYLDAELYTDRGSTAQWSSSSQ